METGKPSGFPVFTGTEPCIQVGYDLYDIEHPTPSEVDRMREACLFCPMVQQCFTWAVHHERYLFWAGTTMEERRQIRKVHNIRLVELGTTYA